MICVGTYVKVVDNTGGSVGQCIRVFGKDVAGIGDKIVITLKKVRSKSRIKKKEIYKALVLRTRKPFIRDDGTVLKFYDNSVVLLNKKGDPIGNKLKGPITMELRASRSVKSLSISSLVV